MASPGNQHCAKLSAHFHSLCCLRGPRFESRCRRLWLSRWQYAALGTGCALTAVRSSTLPELLSWAPALAEVKAWISPLLGGRWHCHERYDHMTNYPIGHIQSHWTSCERLGSTEDVIYLCDITDHHNLLKLPLLLWWPHCKEVGMTVNLGRQMSCFLAIPVTGSSLQVTTFAAGPLQR